MTKVNVYEAKTNLSRLIERARAGEEIVIARAGTPMVRLVPVEEPRPKRRLGMWEGQGWFADDWDSPEVNEEITRMFLGDDGE